MEINFKSTFTIIFIVITLIFSILAYDPSEIIIGGPYFPQIEYFENELEIISKDLNLDIKYIPFSDIESEIIHRNYSKDIDIAIIPNPQGVISLGNKGYLQPINLVIDQEIIKKNYSQHFIDINTSDKDGILYGILFRLIPNSIIWYDVDKFQGIGSPNFKNYEEMVLFTKEYASKGKPLWCMDIESGSSTGWIATNWLEDLILSEYGPSTYDKWSKQKIKSQDNEITLSILKIGKLIFSDDSVFRGHERIIYHEFNDNYKNLLDENNPCVFSWSGHFASLYFPDDKTYGRDYDFFKFPSENSGMVGVGDSIVILNSSTKTVDVFKSLIEDSFGHDWISEEDSMFISANKNSSIELINNELLFKETQLTREALNKNLFRYDASELMERRIGADHLLNALRKYISLGNEYIEQITEGLDSKY